MIRPVTFIKIQNSAGNQDCLASPLYRKRTDSLIFSITSQKSRSPRDTMLISCKQNDVSKQLETLQLKLQSLENKVHHINSEQSLVIGQFNDNYLKTSIITQPHRQKYYEQANKENSYNEINKVGKIVKKQRINNHLAVTKNKNKQKLQNTMQSRGSLMSNDSQIHLKNKQLSKLKKQLSTLKKSIEKTQRSKSLYSDRLSLSKNIIKDLKKEQKKYEKLYQKVKRQLKKSQTIREKQKQIIIRQQEQLQNYKKYYRLSKIR